MTADGAGFEVFTREAWAALRASTPLSLDDAELRQLAGQAGEVSREEVVEVYLPLARLLNLHVAATRALREVTATFLGRAAPAVPYVVGIAGSVAAGKSTTARVLQALLAKWPDHPRVDLVPTDGFLLSNAELEARGLLERKGFPESYDRRRLVAFLSDLKSGRLPVEAPVYSHLHYDLMPGEVQRLEAPDIVLLEGLNVLQGDDGPRPEHGAYVSDYFDFSIFVDAAEPLLVAWFLSRFERLRATAFRDPASYFHGFVGMSPAEAEAFATAVWHEINGRNLRENILPTRSRARLILEKGTDHRVERVLLRRG